MSGFSCWDLPGPARTLRFGQALGRLLRAGDVVGLRGPLGAGKTLLTQGVAAGIGVPDDQPVVSPTFVLVRQYVGRLKLYHIDAYRLGGADDLIALGFEEMVEEPGAAVVVEWADRVTAALPAHTWWVDLFHVSPRRRRACVRVPDVRRRSGLADELAAAGLRMHRGGFPGAMVDSQCGGPDTSIELE